MTCNLETEKKIIIARYKLRIAKYKLKNVRICFFSLNCEKQSWNCIIRIYVCIVIYQHFIDMFIKRKTCKWEDCLDSNLKCSFLLSADIKQDCDPKLPFSKTIEVNLQAIGERL